MNEQAVDEDGFPVGAQVTPAERIAARTAAAERNADWPAIRAAQAAKRGAVRNHPERQRRVLLVRTSDPHTNLRPGSKGTVLRASADPFAPGHTILEVAWDDGSTLSLLSAAGDLWGLES